MFNWGLADNTKESLQTNKQTLHYHFHKLNGITLWTPVTSFQKGLKLTLLEQVSLRKWQEKYFFLGKALITDVHANFYSECL